MPAEAYSLFGKQAGKGGELSGKETSIISGALELAEKTARDAMTPVSEVFSVDINAKLDMYDASLLGQKYSKPVLIVLHFIHYIFIYVQGTFTFNIGQWA